MDHAIIRTATEADLDAVWYINENAQPHVNGVSMDFMRWSLETCTWFGVAELAGNVMGFCTVLGCGLDYQSLNYQWFTARYDDFVYIDRIAVAPQAQSLGLGRGLYETAIADLTGKALVLACEVNIKPRNEPSLKFHERMGFEIVGQQDTEGGSKTVAMHLRQLGK